MLHVFKHPGAARLRRCAVHKIQHAERKSRKSVDSAHAHVAAEEVAHRGKVNPALLYPINPRAVEGFVSRSNQKNG
jgi:hypothetical protein